MSNFPSVQSVEELEEDMIEFGFSYDVAERVAPALYLLFNDERVEEELKQQAPLLAEKIGLARRH